MSKKTRQAKTTKAAGSRGYFAARKANGVNQRNRTAKLRRHMRKHPNDKQAARAVAVAGVLRGTPNRNHGRVLTIGTSLVPTKGFDLRTDKNSKMLVDKLSGLTFAMEPVSANLLNGRLSSQGREAQMIQRKLRAFANMDNHASTPVKAAKRPKYRQGTLGYAISNSTSEVKSDGTVVMRNVA